MSGRNAVSKLIEKYRKPCVIGHLHGNATIQYLNNGIDTCWAMCTGCLVDPHSVAMGYGKHNTDMPVLTVGLIIDGMPSLIPFRRE